MSHLVLGCDGVWDVVTDSRAAELVARYDDPEHARYETSGVEN